MTRPVSGLRSLVKGLNRWLHRMADSIFDKAVDPAERDESARGEFTSELTRQHDGTSRSPAGRRPAHIRRHNS